MADSPELEVPLKSDAGEATLLLTPSSLHLLVAVAGQGETTTDVLAQTLHYEERTFGDRITIGPAEYTVPTGKGADATRAIATARLRDGKGRLPAIPEKAPLLAERSELESLWLAAWLEDGERVLAWLHSATTTKVQSPIVGRELEAETRLVLTTRRAAVVAVNRFGDVGLIDLPPQPVKTKRSLGRVNIDVSGVQIQSELGNAGEFEMLAALATRSLQEKALAVALCCRDAGKEGRARATELVSWLVDDDDPWATIAGRFAGLDVSVRDESLRAAVQRAVGIDGASIRFVDWYTGWKATPVQGLSVVDLLRALGSEPALSAAADLRARVREALLEGKKDVVELATLDLEHALLLREAGRDDAALALLEQRLEALPAPELLDLVPHPDEDPTEDGQAIRVRLLAELVTLRGVDSTPDAATLAEIARLQPLNADRLRALRDAADGALVLRAAAVLALLEPGALGVPSDAAENEPPKALSEELLKETLQHPVAREGGALSKLQAALAQVKVPDHGALRSYCERLTQRENVAHCALTDAVVVLGVRGVEGYISRGDKAVGVRAYEGKPPFLLIGGNHIGSQDAEALMAAEQRFAIGAEVAHLRFEHARVTSSELWSGAFEKGKATLETVLSVVPLFGAFKWGERAAAVAGHLQGDAAKSVFGFAGKVFGKKEEVVDPALGVGTEQLLAAHRVMQFTADRAGLVLCGDLRSAIRAIFLTWPLYSAELSVVDRLGLRAGLSRRDAEGQLMHPDLAVRLGALLAFYLDDDYEKLRTAIVA